LEGKRRLYCVHKVIYAIFWNSRADNSRTNDPILAIYERNHNQIDINRLCKFHKDWMKNEGSIVCTRSNMHYFENSRADNSRPSDLILAIFERDWGLMNINRLCKFHKYWLKIEGCIVFTRWNMQYFGIQGQITPEPMTQFWPFSIGIEVSWI